MASAASSIKVTLIEYSRSDAEFETCLATEPFLQACLDKLHKAGYSVLREAMGSAR